MAKDRAREDLDLEAAVTRSLLGWGVVAGMFYLVVGLVLAMARPGFELSRHALSLLMLGDHGWMQAANLVLSGLMTLAAAYGFVRAIRSGRGLALGVLVGVYGVCLLLSALFPPDPMSGFPPGSAQGAATTSGMLHLVIGAMGFVALGAAAVTHGLWCRGRGETRRGAVSVVLGVVVVGAFLAGGALASVGLLWLAVVAGWAWLAIASAHVYTVVPHPVLSRRAA